MARITVEDCVLRIPNRFKLVLLASQRGRDISAGAPLSVERDNDKNPVIALREIAEETVSVDVLREAQIQAQQRLADVDEPEDDDMAHMLTQQFTEVAEDASREPGWSADVQGELDRDLIVGSRSLP